MGRYLVFGAAMLPALSAAAMDQPKYDLKLEKAAMDVIAAKIGEIRPGFGYGQRPVFIMSPESAAVSAAGAPPQLPASAASSERQSTGSIQVLSAASTPAADGSAQPGGDLRVIEY
ncbi:hypothetical protein [Mesorhizobium sp. CN2-181]|uniref:hypothetical protein n=1 Tax=Mesorhizobium yinganensis TaxID=3157707 RepID=UPI0032B76476